MREPGLDMQDPHQPEHMIWVREQDREAFEKRGYIAIPSQDERKGRVAAPPAPPVDEQKSDAGDEEVTPAAAEDPASDPSTDDEPSAVATNSFPRKRARNSAPQG